MGCVCCSLSSFASIVLDALERISLCTVCAMLTCCLLFTIITVMVMGIGIGYHYCFVSNSVDSMAKAAKAAGALRSGGEQTPGHVMRSVDKAIKRGFAHRMARREVNGPTPWNNTNNGFGYKVNGPTPRNNTNNRFEYLVNEPAPMNNTNNGFGYQVNGPTPRNNSNNGFMYQYIVESGSHNNKSSDFAYQNFVANGTNLTKCLT